MSKVPIDKTYLNQLFKTHKSFLKKFHNEKSSAKLQAILKDATSAQVNTLIRIFYLVIHEGLFFKNTC